MGLCHLTQNGLLVLPPTARPSDRPFRFVCPIHFIRSVVFVPGDPIVVLIFDVPDVPVAIVVPNVPDVSLYIIGMLLYLFIGDS